MGAGGGRKRPGALLGIRLAGGRINRSIISFVEGLRTPSTSPSG